LSTRCIFAASLLMPAPGVFFAASLLMPAEQRPHAARRAGQQRRRKGRSRKSAELAALVRGALEQTVLLELLPRAQIEVCIQVLFADGGVAAACINAAMLAVADAGAPWLLCLLTSAASLHILASCTAGLGCDTSPKQCTLALCTTPS